MNRKGQAATTEVEEVEEVFSPVKIRPKRTEKAMIDGSVADVVNLTDADDVINRNVVVALVLPGKGLTTADV